MTAGSSDPLILKKERSCPPRRFIEISMIFLYLLFVFDYDKRKNLHQGDAMAGRSHAVQQAFGSTRYGRSDRSGRFGMFVHVESLRRGPSISAGRDADPRLDVQGGEGSL